MVESQIVNLIPIHGFKLCATNMCCNIIFLYISLLIMSHHGTHGYKMDDVDGSKYVTVKKIDL